MSPVKAYWWRRVENFGDRLAPLLLARFAYLETTWAPINEADVVSVGSVLEHVPTGWAGYILGSGLLRETSKLKFDPALTKILALRGPLTARSFTGEFALGDPGLLANELIEQQPKQWDLGIFPHWQDDQLSERFQKLIPAQYTTKVINPADDPIQVLKEISASRRIVTSSLHGVICADSFGIPRRVEYCSKLDADGGLFKFKDYSESIHSSLEIGKMSEPNRNRVEDAQSEIFHAYRELGRYHGQN